MPSFASSASDGEYLFWDGNLQHRLEPILASVESKLLVKSDLFLDGLRSFNTKTKWKSTCRRLSDAQVNTSMSFSSLSLSSHSGNEGIPLVDREIKPIGANSSSESFSVESDFQNAQPIFMVKSSMLSLVLPPGSWQRVCRKGKFPPISNPEEVMGKKFDLKMKLTMAGRSKTNPTIENPILQPSKRPKLEVIQAAPTLLIPGRETNTEVPKTVENPVAMPKEITIIPDSPARDEKVSPA
ncbi:hypothetical protein VNO80_15731 [Phaseolus coccineus]|uniref:Uncharacterized protein n=1 Tax=Phaseolus coccineus TaxID=3886 RepID=A0AAN9MKT1_PHACN